MAESQDCRIPLSIKVDRGEFISEFDSTGKR